MSIDFRLSPEEALLNYPEALSSLEKSIEFGGKDEKDSSTQGIPFIVEWNKFNPRTLQSLGDFIDEKLGKYGCDHTLFFTKEWLDGNMPKSKRTKSIKAIRRKGGFCDCEVLANLLLKEIMYKITNILK